MNIFLNVNTKDHWVGMRFKTQHLQRSLSASSDCFKQGTHAGCPRTALPANRACSGQLSCGNAIDFFFLECSTNEAHTSRAVSLLCIDITLRYKHLFVTFRLLELLENLRLKGYPPRLCAAAHLSQRASVCVCFARSQGGKGGGGAVGHARSCVCVYGGGAGVWQNYYAFWGIIITFLIEN